MNTPLPITIQTADGPLSLPAGSTVADALPHLIADATQQAGVATALNGEFVARGERPWRVLADGDTLLCFTAITGG